MCGRYVVTNPIIKTQKIVKTAIQIKDVENYNAHPGQELPIIKSYKNGKTLENHSWGITPKWAKKDFKPIINARLETINEKISFKELIKISRCVVVADGFYEWKRSEKNKTPYYFSREDQKTLFIAGIFESNKFCLITENASDNIQEIHHRQPVIINESEIKTYLNLETNGSLFLNERKKPLLNFYQISKNVNKPTNNSILLIQKI